MSQSNNGSFWPIVLFVIGLAFLMQLFAGNSGSSTSTSNVNTGSGEYRYAKERFRQEGFSDADSATAAEAVIKFHNTQKARGR